MSAVLRSSEAFALLLPLYSILPIFSRKREYCIFFFFFYWHYSPLWALACRTMSFHFFPYLLPTLSIFSLPALEDLFLLPLSIFSWVFPFFSSLLVLKWRSFWASYPPPFFLVDLTSLSFALLSILLYFLLRLSLLVLKKTVSLNVRSLHPRDKARG